MATTFIPLGLLCYQRMFQGLKWIRSLHTFCRFTGLVSADTPELENPYDEEPDYYDEPSWGWYEDPNDPAIWSKVPFPFIGDQWPEDRFALDKAIEFEYMGRLAFKQIDHDAIDIIHKRCARIWGRSTWTASIGRESPRGDYSSIAMAYSVDDNYVAFGPSDA
ncbi:hypothetical protein ABW21_db0202127 [Orbilia brochopaga]|nr:hypothetical protein ABW21_db0202127 [Drechslerella brochopaga]